MSNSTSVLLMGNWQHPTRVDGSLHSPIWSREDRSWECCMDGVGTYWTHGASSTQGQVLLEKDREEKQHMGSAVYGFPNPLHGLIASHTTYFLLTYHTTFFCTMFIICPPRPPLSGGKDFCLFCSFLYPMTVLRIQWIEQCSINIVEIKYW